MAGMAIDGLVSGLNTTALINGLMQIEAMPQTLLKSKQTAAQSFVSALQGLNARLSSLAEAAGKAANPASWSAWTATASATGTTATASADARPGALSFSVDAVATSRVAVTAAVPDDGGLVPGYPPTVTVKGADGSLVTVHPTSGSLADVAKAINEASAAGVQATVVRVTNGDVPTYRIQFTGTATGSTGGFEVYAGSGADVGAGTATRLDVAQVRAAQDAQVTLWKGTPLEQSFQQSSNTFTGLMTGVDVTVSRVTAADEDPVTVTVARDVPALTKLASSIVGSIGVVLSEIATRTATTTKVNADGTTSVTGGILSADSAVRGVQRAVSEAMGWPVDGRSPSEIGIVVARDGTFSFDEAKFTAALAADPARVESMVTQLAQRVADTATRLSDKYDGSLTLKIQGQERMVRDMGDQIEGWDRRLELRRASLQRTYSALEVTLSGLQSQSSWLASQLQGLPSWSSSNKS